MTAELKKVRGKEGILFKLTDAAVGKPDETVRAALYPVVGEKTLQDLVAEVKANGKVFKAQVRTTLRSSYSSYYRQMLPPLLRALGFACNNTAYRPVMDALMLPERHAKVGGKTRFYDASEAVPMDEVMRRDWREAVVDEKGRVERIPYELCVLVALPDADRAAREAEDRQWPEPALSEAGPDALRYPGFYDPDRDAEPNEAAWPSEDLAAEHGDAATA